MAVSGCGQSFAGVDEAPSVSTSMDSALCGDNTNCGDTNMDKVNKKRDQNRKAAQRFRDKKKRGIEEMKKLPELNYQLNLDNRSLHRQIKERQVVLGNLQKENQTLEQQLQEKRIENRNKRQDYVLFKGRLEMVVNNHQEEKGSCVHQMLEGLVQRQDSGAPDWFN